MQRERGSMMLLLLSISPQISLLHPNVPPPPPPKSFLLHPPPSQPAFSHYLCWWAFKAMPCSACGRYRERLVGFLDSQRATSHSVCRMAHTESCVLRPHILTNTSLDNGRTCSAEFSDGGTKAAWEALWKHAASPCTQASVPFTINTELVAQSCRNFRKNRGGELEAPQYQFPGQAIFLFLNQNSECFCCCFCYFLIQQ